MGTRNNLVGRKFGRLLVLKFHKTRTQRAYWPCKCDCGQQTSVSTSDLTRSKGTKSCGCISAERFTTHGRCKHEIYGRWRGFMARCYNEQDTGYHNYGGRGIVVCDRWHNIDNFIEDMYPSYKKGLSLDRIDVNRDYSLDNCRWATDFEQNKNRTTSSAIQSEVPHVSFKKGDKRWSVAYRFVNQLNAEEFALKVEQIFKQLDDKPTTKLGS